MITMETEVRSISDSETQWTEIQIWSVSFKCRSKQWDDGYFNRTKKISIFAWIKYGTKRRRKRKRKKKREDDDDDDLVLVEEKRDYLKMKPKSEITRYKQQQRMVERESVIVCNGSGNEQSRRLQKDIIDQRMRRVHVYSPTKDPRFLSEIWKTTSVQVLSNGWMDG